LFEDEFWVEKTRVDFARGFEARADDEDFGGLHSTCFGFEGFDFGEEFFEDPDQGVVVRGSEHFLLFLWVLYE
jgi:hypothetical protein